MQPHLPTSTTTTTQPPSFSLHAMSMDAPEPAGNPQQAPRQVVVHRSIAVNTKSQQSAGSRDDGERLSKGVERGGGCHQPPSAAAQELSTPAGQVSPVVPRQAPCQLAASFEVAVDQGLRPPASHSWSPRRLSEGVERGGGCHQPPSAAAEELSTPAVQVPSVVPRQAPCQVAARFEVAVDPELHLPAAYPLNPADMLTTMLNVAAPKPVTGDQEISATACQISAGTRPTPLAAPAAPPPAVAAAPLAAPAAPPSAAAAAPLAVSAAPPSAWAAAPLAAPRAPPPVASTVASPVASTAVMAQHD